MDLKSINKFHPASGEEIIFLLEKRVMRLALAVTYAADLGYDCRAVGASKDRFIARIREADANYIP